MEHGDRMEASRRRSERVIAFAAASLVAPFATLMLMLGVGTFAGSDGSIPSSTTWPHALGIFAVAIVFMAGASVVFGFLGSAFLLWITFGVLFALTRDSERIGRRRFMLAGAVAGGLHVGLAAWSTQGWPPGPGVLLGTWLVGGYLKNGVWAVAVGPIFAGVLAGAVYAHMSSAWRRRSNSLTTPA